MRASTKSNFDDLWRISITANTEKGMILNPRNAIVTNLQKCMCPISVHLHLGRHHPKNGELDRSTDSIPPIRCRFRGKSLENTVKKKKRRRRLTKAR